VKVDTNITNNNFCSLLKNSELPVLLDANFLISPDRTNLSTKFKPVSYSEYLANWIEPLTQRFSNLCVHEAVRDEICMKAEKEALETLIHKGFIKLVVDSSLSKSQRIMRNTVEKKIIHTGLFEYIPGFHSSKDKGEVKTLSYAAAKGIPLFSSKDQMALQVVLQAEKLHSGLDSIGMIYFYEFIYALHKGTGSNKDFLRKIYKDVYFFTKNEKIHNPEWGSFVPSMDLLYSDLNLS